MEPFYGEWIILILNAVIIALVLAAPILVGIFLMRILRKGVSKDRQQFEEEISARLQEITQSQAEIKKILEHLIESRRTSDEQNS
jgi:uncharacterized membrane-anchored protein YhcB (DUF1043 family)